MVVAWARRQHREKMTDLGWQWSWLRLELVEECGRCSFPVERKVHFDWCNLEGFLEEVETLRVGGTGLGTFWR